MPRTGYQTSPPTGGGNVAAILTIDKSGFYRGAKETGRALTSMMRKVNAEIKANGHSGEKLKVNMTVAEGSTAQVAHKVERVLNFNLDDTLRKFSKEMSRDGKAFFREIIKSAPNRVKPRPGRIDTHLMLDKVQGRVNHYKDFTEIGVGWNISGTGIYYRYFSFQEDGTRNGPMPMRAVPKTAHYLSSQFRNKMAKELKARMDKI